MELDRPRLLGNIRLNFKNIHRNSKGLINYYIHSQIPFPANSNQYRLNNELYAIKGCEPFPPFDGELKAVHGELGGREGTAEKIRRAIEAAGGEFIDENGGGPGIRLRKPQQKKGSNRG
jgi:hypothetical protein